MSDLSDPGAMLAGLREEHLARRIKYEMEQRGWSQERLTAEMAAAGHTIHQSAISKIINPRDGKRRSINVDEAIGFARVFDTSLELLLLPLEAVQVRELRAALNRLDQLSSQALGIFDEQDEARQTVARLLGDEEVAKAFAVELEDGGRNTPEQAAGMVQRWLERTDARHGLVMLRARAAELGRDWDSYREEEVAFLGRLYTYVRTILGEDFDLAAVKAWRDDHADRLRSSWLGEVFDRLLHEREHQGDVSPQERSHLLQWLRSRREALQENKRVPRAS